MPFFHRIYIFVFFMLFGSLAEANIIQNGSFENGINPPTGGYRKLESINTNISGWTVSEGNIDWIKGYYEPAEGSRCIDMVGTIAGKIEQSFPTAIGQRYFVIFNMAGNPVSYTGVTSLEISAAGASKIFSFDNSSVSTTYMKWEAHTWSFVANDTQTTLSFRSLANYNRSGPSIDNVIVEPLVKTLSDVDDEFFGESSLTRDIIHNVDYLDVTKSIGKSYNQLVSLTQPGGEFEDFQIATISMVRDLLESAGINVDANVMSEQYYTKMKILMHLLGVTRHMYYETTDSLVDFTDMITKPLNSSYTRSSIHLLAHNMPQPSTTMWSPDYNGNADTSSAFSGGLLYRPVYETDDNYSTRKLSQTKYGVDTSESQDNSWPNQKEDDASPDLITHVLYPFQIGSMSGDVDGYKWIENDLMEIFSIKRESEDTRQPLILIHGWQADKNGDYNNRSPVELAKHPDENDYDAEGYWWTFLRYFATNDELKKRYKIYLYQYPSYKHITFNARMLSNMLYEVKYIRNWIGQDKKISILAHSMGGLISRSFLEEHEGVRYREDGEWKIFKYGEDLLDKLISLDTPHHGSPAAVYPWIDKADDPIVGKDLYSPGALDLWWDGYDGVYKIIPDNDLDECPLDLPRDIPVDSANSWRDSNEYSFDNYYRILAEDISARSIVRCSGTAFVLFYDHPNPWLTYLNTKKHDQSAFQDKYIFYGGYNDSPFLADHSDKLTDNGIFDLGDNVWVTGVWKAGYLNDSPVPVTSSFFDTVKTACFDDIPACESKTGESISGWPDDNHIGMFWGNFVLDDAKNILWSKTNEGFQIRFFKDYHHDRMLHGAYKNSDRGIKKPLVPITCEDRGKWGWDLVLTDDLFAPCKSGFVWEPRMHTGFRTSQFRLDYIKDAGGPGLKEDEMMVSDLDYSGDATWKSTLEYEPLFLMLKNDLLSSSFAGDVNGDSSLNLTDVLIGLKVMVNSDPVSLAIVADINDDGKIGMPEILYSLYKVSTCTDNDGDGYFAESSCGVLVDCNDQDPAISPNIDEICSDGIDQDCNGSDLLCFDTSMVAYYPFNGSANDASGNENHGTVLGATFTENRFGNPNSAYYFDGEDDYIDIGNADSLKPALPVTISAWLKSDNTTVGSAIFSNDYKDNRYHGVWLSISDQVTLAFGDGGSCDPSNRRSFRGSTLIQQGVWYHVVGIIRGAQDMDLYINGQHENGTYTGSGGPLDYDSSSGNIGKKDSNIYNPPTYFNGAIDEIRFYNRELTQTEINELMN